MFLNRFAHRGDDARQFIGTYMRMCIHQYLGVSAAFHQGSQYFVDVATLT